MAILQFLRPPSQRHLPVGAEILAGGEVGFRVWAPACHRVEVVLADGTVVGLEPEPDGYWSGRSAAAAAGTLYRYRLDGGESLLPDPASRFQPDGPHGPSEVIDPAAYAWSDQDWQGVESDDQVIYEMHVGTFTPEGSWSAAMAGLPGLRDIGITVIEVMPVADFVGRFGWGYDGVDLFAPTRLYGRPEDFKRFVDAAHGLGIAVILDVVYNHFGPSGNYLKQFSPAYFSTKYGNDWGEAINFDDSYAGPVREFFISNAEYWIREFHLDGLRLDATQQIYDESEPNILQEIGRAVRQAAGDRTTLIVAENEPQQVRLVQPIDQGGFGLDALWNDDFHHSAMVALTGRHEAYYSDHRGTPQEFVSAAKYGYLFQGQRYSWQKQRRGTPALGLGPCCFVNFTQNHDQVANSARGLRGHQLTSPGRWRAMTALMLLMPGTPMLFQGQEFAASTPFLYFADHEPELNAAIRRGRAEFLTQFPSITDPAAQACLADPGAVATFAGCRLDPAERAGNAEAVALHRDLLALRRSHDAFRSGRRCGFDGAVLGSEAFVLRFFGPDGDDRLVVVNLGGDLVLVPAPEPLLAPPLGRRWATCWSSEAVSYGGSGVVEWETPEGWFLPGHAAAVLAPADPETEAPDE